MFLMTVFVQFLEMVQPSQMPFGQYMGYANGHKMNHFTGSSVRTNVICIVQKLAKTAVKE